MLGQQPFISFNKSIYRIISILFFVSFLLQVVVGSIIVYESALKDSRDYVLTSIKRIENDINYSNGKWNLYRYNADPNAADTYPIYILGSDGYVVDRWKPVFGYLDTSDFKHLITFTTPQTINTPTNQKWRMYSKLVTGSNNAVIGVITVSYFNPTDDNTSVDTKISNEADIIASKIIVKNDQITNISIDPRDLNYDVAYQVVDQYNKILAKSNNSNSIDRIPNFIDSSYVGNLIDNPGFQQIQDNKTSEKFIVYATPLTDSNNDTVGVLVVGKSISFIDNILVNYIISKLIYGFIITVVFATFALWVIRRYLNKYLRENRFKEEEIKKISFNKASSTIYIDDLEIAIPYATNQYTLCATLFSAPRKHWETDELLEKFGEHELENNWRKVYDTMLIVNKKVSQYASIKLIISKDKVYQLNPQLLSKILV